MNSILPISVAIVSMSHTGLTLMITGMLLLCFMLLAETSTIVLCSITSVIVLVLLVILLENCSEVVALTLSSGLSFGLQVQQFGSETLMFAGLFTAAAVLSLSSMPTLNVVPLASGAMCITLVLAALGMCVSSGVLAFVQPHLARPLETLISGLVNLVEAILEFCGLCPACGKPLSTFYACSYCGWIGNIDCRIVLFLLTFLMVFLVLCVVAVCLHRLSAAFGVCAQCGAPQIRGTCSHCGWV
jgi:hypothetical protein